MSKYILVVDLPDDSKCHGCKTYRPLGYYAEQFSELGMCIRRTDSAEDDTVQEIINAVRPTDCPLIPVDRVMWKMNYLNDQENVTGSQATAWCQHVLRDELGVTE